MVWRASGEKRNLTGVHERDGALWHRMAGAVPVEGERLQCHLDVERRTATERAHTGMHLLIHTMPRGLGRFAADPEVRGGGTVRLTIDGPPPRPEVLAGWRQAALAAVADDRPVERLHVTDAEVAHRLRPQPFADAAFPGPPETKEAVAVAGLGALPCDGTHAERTAAVGAIVLAERHAGRGGAVLIWRVGAA